MARRVLELKGYKSLRALNAFSALVLGLKMLPAYLAEDYETFLDRLQNMSPDDQRKMLIEAVQFVELQPEEVSALACFCTDKNGVPYTAENVKNLKPDEMVEIIVAVCMEIAQIKIDFVTESEKKN
jgi:hypothetical protein